MTFNLETPLNDSEFNKFRKLIYSIAGISLSERKRELVKARLARRLRALDLSSYSEYYSLLNDAAAVGDELEQFVNCLTTNKTEFFRESHHFDYLRNEFFPALKTATLAGREKKLRIWCAASSTGQEPYTLAMSMLDYFGPNSGWDMRLLASDIDTQVLATASAGIYPESELDVIPSTMRTKYFLRESRGEDAKYRAKDELKQLITFRQLNLNQSPWPINVRFDAIFCRNVMIYFDQPTQTKLIENFSQHLQPEGLLVIGHSESLFSITDQFDSLGDTIYKMKPSHDALRPLAVSRMPNLTNQMTTTPSVSAANRPAVERAEVSRAAAPVAASIPRPVPARSAVTAMQPQRPAAQDQDTDRPDLKSQLHGLPVRAIIVGEYEAFRDECVLRTTLGSCVAACLYDHSTRLGGMNHFMLPDSQTDERVCASYGVHAMELLINAIMQLGGNRRHLVAKIFGGAHVVDSFTPAWDIGSRNVEFVKKFLDTERIPIIAEHVNGNLGRKVYFIPTTGKVLLQMLDKRSSADVDRTQRQQGKLTIDQTRKRATQSATLFELAQRQ